MPNWFDIRITTEVENRNAVRNKIMGWPNEVAQTVYWPALTKIGQDGVKYMRQIILESETETGQARVALGGNGPGRYKTGTMYKAVKSRANKRAGEAFTLFVGWNAGTPGYAIFQEHGTRNGVKAMDSIEQTREYMYSRLQELAKSGRVDFADTSFQGNESSNN